MRLSHCFIIASFEEKNIMKKQTLLFISLSILCLTFAQLVTAQTLNIGNITAMKTQNEIIYLAGQKGIAAVKSDQNIIWEKQLPNATFRLITIDNNNIAWSSYELIGAQSQVLSVFSSTWDKLTFANNVVGLLDINGKEIWTSTLDDNSKLSAPAIGNNLIAVNSIDFTNIIDKTNGKLIKSVRSNQKMLFGGSSIMAHNTPNKPLITSNAIYAACILKFCKFDLQGNPQKDKTSYGMMAPLGVMTTSPFEFKNLIFVSNAPYGHRGQKDGVARLFAVNPDLDEKWDEFVDKSGQTGVSSITFNSKYIFVATNFDVMAFNEKGKDIWEFDKIGKPTLRGLGYSGNTAFKISNSDFFAADENAVFIASKSKIEKKVFKENVTVIDANTGKFVKKTDIEGVIVEIGLLNNKVVVVTEDNKITSIDK